MASLKTLVFLAIFLVLHLTIAKKDVCKEVECGRGKCKPSSNGTMPYYICECDLGWKQTRADDDNHLKFLPCIVPNCTLNSACTAAHSPVQQKEDNGNQSIFDICSWTKCGGGSCNKNKTSPFTYDCKCSEGYFNLFNVSFFPCYQECAIGLDCANLGILNPNKSSSTTPTVSQDVNQGLKLLGKCHWVIILALFLAVVP